MPPLHLSDEEISVLRELAEPLDRKQGSAVAASSKRAASRRNRDGSVWHANRLGATTEAAPVRQSEIPALLFGRLTFSVRHFRVVTRSL